MNPIRPLIGIAAIGVLAACSASPVTTTNSPFTRADRDGNGGLTMAEYYQLVDIQAQDGYPLAESLSEEPTQEKIGKQESRFKYLDTNSNGLLERNELGIF